MSEKKLQCSKFGLFFFVVTEYFQKTVQLVYKFTLYIQSHIKFSEI